MISGFVDIVRESVPPCVASNSTADAVRNNVNQSEHHDSTTSADITVGSIHIHVNIWSTFLMLQLHRFVLFVSLVKNAVMLFPSELN